MESVVFDLPMVYFVRQGKGGRAGMLVLPLRVFLLVVHDHGAASKHEVFNLTSAAQALIPAASGETGVPLSSRYHESLLVLQSEAMDNIPVRALKVLSQLSLCSSLL